LKKLIQIFNTMNVDDRFSSSLSTTRLENTVVEFIQSTADRKSVTRITAEVLLSLLRKKDNAEKVCSSHYISYMAKVKQSINGNSSIPEEAVENHLHANDSEMVIPGYNNIPGESREEEKAPMEQVEVLERPNINYMNSSSDLRDYPLSLM